KLEGTCSQLRDIGVKAEPFVCEVTDSDEIPAVVDRVAATFGGIDILVNNAYKGSYGPLLSMTDEDFQAGFRSGPFAAFRFIEIPIGGNPGVHAGEERIPFFLAAIAAGFVWGRLYGDRDDALPA